MKHDRMISELKAEIDRLEIENEALRKPPKYFMKIERIAQAHWEKGEEMPMVAVYASPFGNVKLIPFTQASIDDAIKELEALKNEATG